MKKNGEAVVDGARVFAFTGKMAFGAVRKLERRGQIREEALR